MTSNWKHFRAFLPGLEYLNGSLHHGNSLGDFEIHVQRQTRGFSSVRQTSGDFASSSVRRPSAKAWINGSVSSMELDSRISALTGI